jgi:hypothetical protein
LTIADFRLPIELGIGLCSVGSAFDPAAFDRGGGVMATGYSQAKNQGVVTISMGNRQSSIGNHQSSIVNPVNTPWGDPN